MRYKVTRVEGKPSDPGGMVVTMERMFLDVPMRLWALLALSVGFLVVAISLPSPAPKAPAGKELAPVAVAAEPVGNVVDSVDSWSIDMEDPLEAEKIEAALVKQGYFRDDIPLSYIEQDYLHTAASEFGVDYYVMVALIERETNFQNIYGDGGNAYGYCQIWPKWWSGLMAEIGAEDLNKPYDNFRTACAILAHLTDYYGSTRDALTHYNTGSPGESEYAKTILERSEVWRNGDDLY